MQLLCWVFLELVEDEHHNQRKNFANWHSKPQTIDPEPVWEQDKGWDDEQKSTQKCEQGGLFGKLQTLVVADGHDAQRKEEEYDGE